MEKNAAGEEVKVWHLSKLINKKELGNLVAKAHKLFGNLRTAEILDIVKKNGYDNACKAGISIAVSDIKIPKEKQQILADAEKQIDKTERMFRRGLMSEDERYRKVIEIWSQATDDVTAKLMSATMDKFNSLNMMADSGARGNTQQIRQLAGMRGLMADPSGEDDCDVVTFNLVKERSRLCKQTLGASQNKLRETVIGRNLASGVESPVTGELIAEADTVITEDIYNKLIAGHVLEVNLYATDDMDGEATETGLTSAAKMPTR